MIDEHRHQTPHTQKQEQIPNIDILANNGKHYKGRRTGQPISHTRIGYDRRVHNLRNIQEYHRPQSHSEVKHEDVQRDYDEDLLADCAVAQSQEPDADQKHEEAADCCADLE